MTPAQALSLINTPSLHMLQSTSWADLGCGSGLFTLALATLLQPGSTIYAVDQKVSLKQHLTPNQITIQPIKADFEKQDLGLRDLEGIIMANSFHYIKDKRALLQRLKPLLRPKHLFLIVEYDTDRPVATWVPFPLSFSALQSLFHTTGYSTITHLADQPSIYNKTNIYSALIT
jgi:ubiquinone/menaquinone biosynthesis C-methylase UbiE